MTYLIDTDWVVDYLAGDPGAINFLQALRPAGLAISIITFTEVYEGIYGGRDPKQAEAVFRSFLQDVEVLGVSRTIARRHGRMRAERRKQRRQINHRALDLLIAATALVYDLSVVTRNRNDYADIAGLKLL